MSGLYLPPVPGFSILLTLKRLHCFSLSQWNSYFSPSDETAASCPLPTCRYWQHKWIRHWKYSLASFLFQEHSKNPILYHFSFLKNARPSLRADSCNIRTSRIRTPPKQEQQQPSLSSLSFCCLHCWKKTKPPLKLLHCSGTLLNSTSFRKQQQNCILKYRTKGGKGMGCIALQYHPLKQKKMTNSLSSVYYG